MPAATIPDTPTKNFLRSHNSSAEKTISLCSFPTSFTYIKTPPASEDSPVFRVFTWFICVGLVVLAGLIESRCSEIGLNSLSELEAGLIAGSVVSVALLLFIARETTAFVFKSVSIVDMTPLRNVLYTKIEPSLADFLDNEVDKKKVADQALRVLLNGEEESVVKFHITNNRTTPNKVKDLFFVKIKQDIVVALDARPKDACASVQEETQNISIP